MATTIKIKSSSVSGKQPAAGDLAVSELALNLADRKLYSKDTGDNVFEIGGKVNSGDTPPTDNNETGDLFWDGDFLLVWNGSDWVPVNASDLDYEAAPDKGTVTNTVGDDAELPLVDATNAGLMSPGDFSKLEDMPAFIAAPGAPDNPTSGDIWVDTGDCPPTINIWNDCDDPGNPSWTPIGGGGSGGNKQGPVQIISSNGTELNATLTAVGGNGVDADGSAVNATYAWTGAKTGTSSAIVADVEGVYTVTASVTFSDGTTQSDSASWTIIDTYVPPTNNTAPVIAVVGEGPDGAYEGNSTYVVTNATVNGGANPVIVETQWFLDGAQNATGSIFSIPDSSVGVVITAKQKFTDQRGTELVSEASNDLTIVERPADVITFTAEISDDGTDDGNQVGKQLTANATNIVGGTAPVEYAFQWYADGAPEAAPAGAQKVKEILPTDVGKTITCEITVAESDGSNAEARTATYGKAIELGVEIKKPVVLSPANGAGIGGDTTYYPETSAITNIDVIPGTSATLSPALTISTGEAFRNGATVDLVFLPNSDPNHVSWIGPDVTSESGKDEGRYYVIDLTQLPLEVGDTIQPLVGQGGNYYDTGDGWYRDWNSGSSGNNTPVIYDGVMTYIRIGWDNACQQIGYFYINEDPGSAADKDNYVSPETVELTLTNDKAFDAADGTEITTIDKVFKAGDKVVGNGDVTVFADSACFSTTLYDGKYVDNSANDFVQTGIDNTGNSLVWIKSRDSDLFDHELTYTSARNDDRGDKYCFSTNNADPLRETPYAIKSLTDNGFYVGASAYTNKNGDRYVAWNFRAAPGFFDIVTWDGTGDNKEIPHSLNSSPGLIITKSTNTANGWYTWHNSFTNQEYVVFNENYEKGDATFDAWGDVTDKSFGARVAFGTNTSNQSYVAYLFADTPGLIKCDVHDSANGQKVTTNFAPGWILIKRNSTSNWYVFAKELGDNTSLKPNTSDKTNSVPSMTFEADGFTTDFSGEYIYVAIVENAQAGQFPPTGVLTEDADASGPSMTLTDVTGEWVDGLTAVNETEVTELAPGADDVVFTSDKPATTSGTVNSWGAAEWELSVDSGFADKQTASVQLQNDDVEQGPTSFTLEADTEYWVHTRYSSNDPAAGPSEWSDANKFKTAGGSSGAYGNFSTTIVPGTGAAHSVDTGVDNTGKALLWQKNRAVGDHILKDTEQGTNWRLSSHNTDAAQEITNGSGVIEFTSTGFKYGISNSQENKDGQEYVVWNFAAAAGFFDVVTYDGDGTQGRQIPHSLGIAPGMIIVKRLNITNDWQVYHESMGATKYINLNTDLPAVTNSNRWNDTEPTSTEFTLGSQTNTVDTNNVAYLFADNPDGGIKCGSYIGDGSTSGNDVDCGFKPGWLMIKNASDSADWIIQDLKRAETQVLRANLSDPEGGDHYVVMNDTGFYPRRSVSNCNAAGKEYIYVAIADTTVLFYDEKALKTVTNHTLTKRYGVDPLETDLRKYGIYPLTEQPTYSVDTFVKEGQAYNPIRNYTGELNRAQQDAAEANARLDDRDDQIRHLKIEVAKAAALEKITTAMEERLAALEAKDEGDGKATRKKR